MLSCFTPIPPPYLPYVQTESSTWCPFSYWAHTRREAARAHYSMNEMVASERRNEGAFTSSSSPLRATLFPLCVSLANYFEYEGAGVDGTDNGAGQKSIPWHSGYRTSSATWGTHFVSIRPTRRRAASAQFMNMAPQLGSAEQSDRVGSYHQEHRCMGFTGSRIYFMSQRKNCVCAW